MTSLFRRRLTSKVISPIKIFLDPTEMSALRSALPTSFKLLRSKDNVPKLQIYWKELLKVKPDLEMRVQPKSIFTLLKNEDLKSGDGITDVDLKDDSNPSFIFSMDQDIFTNHVLRHTYNDFDEYFNRSCFAQAITPERVVLDFSSPNMAKPFHFGHFRSTIIGNVISNIFRYVGHDVVSINYIGDWGLQYGILAVAYDLFGSEEKLQKDPLAHLYEVYQKGNQQIAEEPSFAEKARIHFQKMEQGDAAAIKQWNKFKEYTVSNLNETYKKLGVKFDETHGESMYAHSNDFILKTLIGKNIAFNESDGSIQAIVENGSEEKVILRKSDGTSLYLTRDLSAAIDRESKYHFHSMYYVVDSAQNKHFSNLFHLLKGMGCPWHSKLFHVPFGRISNFSTRKGSAIFLQDILDEAQERTLEKMRNTPTTKVTENVEDVAVILGTSALIINDLSVHRKRNYAFDWDRVLKMEGDCGITLQYCHARLNNIKENCGVELETASDLTPLVESEAVALVEQIARFDEAVYQFYTQLEPYILVQYLFHLRHAVNRANKVLTVKGQPINIARARLLLFHTAQLVLGKGLKILGIQPLNKM